MLGAVGIFYYSAQRVVGPRGADDYASYFEVNPTGTPFDHACEKQCCAYMPARVGAPFFVQADAVVSL